MNKKGIAFMAMGFELGGMIFGALFLGRLIDNTYDLNGIGTLIIIFLVMGGWFYHLYILLRRFMEDDEASEIEDSKHLH